MHLIRCMGRGRGTQLTYCTKYLLCLTVVSAHLVYKSYCDYTNVERWYVDHEHHLAA